LLVSAAQESHRQIRSDMSQQRIRRFRGGVISNVDRIARK
jgi:hypothetical protein